MRTVFGLALVALLTSVCGLGAQPGEPYSSAGGKFKVRFPGQPKVVTKTSETDVGDLTVVTATFATSDGNIYMVSYTDFPTAPKANSHPMVFKGVRDGVCGKDKLVEEKDFSHGPDNLPGREFVVDRDKGKQRVKFRAILREGRLYQLAVIGTPNFAGGQEAKQFLDSFEVSK
jgi:hypothetical protein